MFGTNHLSPTEFPQPHQPMVKPEHILLVKTSTLQTQFLQLPQWPPFQATRQHNLKSSMCLMWTEFIAYTELTTHLGNIDVLSLFHQSTLEEGISAQEWRFLNSQKSRRPLKYKKKSASGTIYMKPFSNQKILKLPTPPSCNPYTKTGPPLSEAGYGICSRSKQSGIKNFMVDKATKIWSKITSLL